MKTTINPKFEQYFYDSYRNPNVPIAEHITLEQYEIRFHTALQAWIACEKTLVDPEARLNSIINALKNLKQKSFEHPGDPSCFLDFLGKYIQGHINDLEKVKNEYEKMGI